jgi:hypothetical protein
MATERRKKHGQQARTLTAFMTWPKLTPTVEAPNPEAAKPALEVVESHDILVESVGF